MCLPPNTRVLHLLQGSRLLGAAVCCDYAGMLMRNYNLKMVCARQMVSPCCQLSVLSMLEDWTWFCCCCLEVGPSWLVPMDHGSRTPLQASPAGKGRGGAEGGRLNMTCWEGLNPPPELHCNMAWLHMTGSECSECLHVRKVQFKDVLHFRWQIIL